MFPFYYGIKTSLGFITIATLIDIDGKQCVVGRYVLVL